LEVPERAAQVQGPAPEQEPERTLQAPAPVLPGQEPPALEPVLLQRGLEELEPERVRT
jgi:hypothetical protein